MEAPMWQLAQAKNKLSEVFSRAMTDGPQVITRRGEEALLVSRADYEKHVAAAPRKMSLGEYLHSAPKVEGLVIERDPSPGREVDFGPDDE
jgi:antitoxin Phd